MRVRKGSSPIILSASLADAVSDKMSELRVKRKTSEDDEDMGEEESSSCFPSIFAWGTVRVRSQPQTPAVGDEVKPTGLTDRLAASADGHRTIRSESGGSGCESRLSSGSPEGAEAV